MPEYDDVPPSSLVNALDYLAAEWTCKPAGLVGSFWTTRGRSGRTS